MRKIRWAVLKAPTASRMYPGAPGLRLWPVGGASCHPQLSSPQSLSESHCHSTSPWQLTLGFSCAHRLGPFSLSPSRCISLPNAQAPGAQPEPRWEESFKQLLKCGLYPNSLCGRRSWLPPAEALQRSAPGSSAPRYTHSPKGDSLLEHNQEKLDSTKKDNWQSSSWPSSLTRWFTLKTNYLAAYGGLGGPVLFGVLASSRW